MSRFIARNFDDYESLYQESLKAPQAFWGEFAREAFIWKKPWDSVLDFDLHEPRVSWFKGGKLNITENCIDRHLTKDGEKTAIIFEPNSTSESAKHITYNQLAKSVNKAANMLKSLGVTKGDRVLFIYAHGA